jgi:hypothetical protein
MKISFATPPLWDKIKAKFPVTEDSHIWYTHGDCIYSPSKIIPPDDIIVHEMVHQEQQESNDDVANIWWQNYMHDPDFRLSQEAEAYGAQYRFWCAKVKDRNQRDKILRQIGQALAGKEYGNCVSSSEAMKLVREFSEHGRPKLDKEIIEF